MNDGLLQNGAGFGAGSATEYDVIRGDIDELPVGAGLAESCMGSSPAAPMTTDPTFPATGKGFWTPVATTHTRARGLRARPKINHEYRSRVSILYCGYYGGTMTSNKSLLVLSLSVSLVFASAIPLAAKRKESTPEDRAKAVRLARELEADPLAENAPEKRRWVVQWYEKVPDITVSICNVLGPLPEGEHPFFGELLIQLMASGGAYIIEHPDKAKDAVAVQSAAVEGALKVYEVFVKAAPEGRRPYLDELLSKRVAGTLGEYLRDTVPKACS